MSDPIADIVALKLQLFAKVDPVAAAPGPLCQWCGWASCYCCFECGNQVYEHKPTCSYFDRVSGPAEQSVPPQPPAEWTGDAKVAVEWFVDNVPAILSSAPGALMEIAIDALLAVVLVGPSSPKADHLLSEIRGFRLRLESPPEPSLELKKCRHCKQRIHWLKAPSGKLVPCDPEPHGSGDEVLIWPDGSVGKEHATEQHGYRGHWLTCRPTWLK